MKKVVSIICILLLLCGCGTGKKEASTLTKEEQLEQLIIENNYIIVDVRTIEEYEEGHVIGAKNIPYDTISKDVALDKNKTIMVYCKSGRRSSIAYDTLKQLGYKVFDLGAYDLVPFEKE